jgi:hypothetical protein
LALTRRRDGLSSQVAWLWQSRFQLSAAVAVQSVFDPHCVLQDEPQAPLHVALPPHVNTQPFV